MIRSVRIENFKSIASAKVELGRVNVLIGENGAGKSNFLEALAFGAAAVADKLDHEFLATRGVRVTAPELMVSAFEAERVREVILSFGREERAELLECQIELPSSADAGWVANVSGLAGSLGGERFPRIDLEQLLDQFQTELQSISERKNATLGRTAGLEQWKRVRTNLFRRKLEVILQKEMETRAQVAVRERPAELVLTPFLVFSPEYSALRVFRDETQILPLGIHGEGLFAHLKTLSKRNGDSVLPDISDQLDLVDWFEGFELPSDLAPGERTLRLRDRYLVEQQVFDQRSANEGFLFLLFYFTLLISPDTPAFFAVDNIDASLNPKLCTELVRRVVKLAETHGKQVILTTHNPAVLDGLDLADDEQRLFAVSRDSKGRTRVKRVAAPKPVGNDSPMRLSEAFVRGYLGALPKNF